MLAVETLAISNVIDGSLYLAKLIVNMPVETYTHRKSLYNSKKKKVLVKRLRIDMGIVKKLFESKTLTKTNSIKSQ